MPAPKSERLLNLLIMLLVQRRPIAKERIRELLSAARDLWRVFPEADDEAERVRTARIAFRLVHLANITAVTSPA